VQAYSGITGTQK